MRAVRQNCGSNFSRLARQRKLPAVAARLFFYLTRICSGGKVRERPEGENCESNFSESPSNCVAKQVLGNGVSVKKLVELLEATTVVSRLFLFNGNIFFDEKAPSVRKEVK